MKIGKAEKMEKWENEEVNPMQSEEKMRLREMERLSGRETKSVSESITERKKDRKRVFLREIEAGG